MKHFIKLTLFILIALSISGCSTMVKEVQKADGQLASYLGVPKLTLDCKAGLAQADADIADDPVGYKSIRAVTLNADVDSEDYQTCYNSYAWLRYVGQKAENSIRTWAKKLAAMGVF